MSKEEETNTTSNIPLDSQTKQTVQKIPLLKTGKNWKNFINFVTDAGLFFGFFLIFLLSGPRFEKKKIKKI